MSLIYTILFLQPDGRMPSKDIQNLIEMNDNLGDKTIDIRGQDYREFGTTGETKSRHNSRWISHKWENSNYKNFGLLDGWKERIKLTSRKITNRLRRAYNGNRGARNSVQIAHWNLGSCKWERKKTEIEALLLEKDPDIIFISEANLYQDLPEYERQIRGYDMYLPDSMMIKHKYVRIVMLARTDLDVQIHPEYMHEDISIIWASINDSSKKKIMVGGVYREHRLLLQPKPNTTKTDTAQNQRWNLIISSWKRAAEGNVCTLIGDTNLDYLRWSTPEASHVRMVEKTREVMETAGFTQVIRGFTRQWRTQADSLVDQCWLNSPERLISTSNLLRGSSDHNYISVIIRTKNKISQGQESLRRVWKNFNPERFRDRIKTIDWEPLYNCENIDLVNDYFVGKVTEALDREAPFKYIQSRKNHVNWMTDELVEQMRDRDMARQKARETDSFEDWRHYRKSRNDCSKELKKRKNEFFRNIFETFSEKNDAKNIYNTAKKLMGWSAPKQPKMFLVNGTLFRRPVDIANILQNFYKKKIESLIGALEKRGRDPLRLLKQALARWDRREEIKTFTLREITKN